MNTATDHATRTRFGGRHPRSVIVIRVLAAAWLLALTGVLLAYGYWGWALLTIAGAVANAVWACLTWLATTRSTHTGRPSRLTLVWTGSTVAEPAF
jgi:hypothetical protein